MNKSIKNIFKGVFIYGATNALKSLVPFLLVPILTSYLSKEEYGIISMIDVFILMLMPFIGVNIEGAVNVSYFKLNKNNLKEYISTAFLFNTILFVVFLGIFFILKNYISSILDIPTQYIIWIPFLCWIRIVPLVVLVLFQAKLQPFRYSIFSITQALFDIALTVLFVKYMFLKIEGRLLGNYIPFGLFSVIGILFLLKDKLFSFFIFSKKHLKHLLGFGVPLIPHALGATIIAMSDRFFIAHFKGTSDVGVYTVAYQIGAVMLLIGTSINQAWSPILFGKLKESLDSGKKFFNKMSVFFAILFIIGAYLVYLLSDYLFLYFVDEKFYEAKKYFPLLLLGFLFQVLYFIFTNILFYFEKTKLLAKITFLGAIVNVLLNYLLIEKLGTMGVAYATAITYLLYFIVVMFFSKKELSLYKYKL